MEEKTTATLVAQTMLASDFNAQLGNRGAFADDRPRITIIAGGALILTAAQNKATSPHAQLFYFGLNPNIRSGTHTIPGPMITSLVYQERKESQWTSFGAIEGSMTLELDQVRKRFKATCSFTVKNINESIEGVANMDVYISEWPTAI
ncbi:hypothetical protein [Pseudomonas sp. Root562]|uniref:hypothetical protein n=1 Tax=Pseudomonas sp. Root562 TaxID=1736561 RepID=UPI0007037FB3|nr:hypothetical protein [Pseudomonas sp. Root562]KQZ78053.1 hypothetical protein ASD60_19505 [Pseudomonas sp. Root562]